MPTVSSASADVGLLEGPEDPGRRSFAAGLTEGTVVGNDDPVQGDGGRAAVSHRAIAPVSVPPGRREREMLRPLLRRGPRRHSPSSSDQRARPTSCREGPNHPRLVRRSSSRRRDAIPGDGRQRRALPVHVPEATSDRKACRCSGRPTSRTTGTNCVMVANSGPGATTRPSSSATTAVSTKESPTPPSSSGMASAGQSRPTIASQSSEPAARSPPRPERGPGCTPSRETSGRSRAAPPDRS